MVPEPCVPDSAGSSPLWAQYDATIGSAPEWQKSRFPSSRLTPHLRGQMSQEAKRAVSRSARLESSPELESLIYEGCMIKILLQAGQRFQGMFIFSA
jgi:hypothetical protein